MLQSLYLIDFTIKCCPNESLTSIFNPKKTYKRNMKAQLSIPNLNTFYYFLINPQVFILPAS